MWEPRHCLFHFGPLRAEHPYTVNHSSVLIEHYGTSMVRFGIYAPVFAGWSVTADLDKLEGWDPNRWHHIAAVWDADAQRAEWLRVYVDGKRASGAIEVAKEERLGEDPSVRAPGHNPYPVQLGSLTSGRAPARALLDELRISRVARYQGDFEPPQSALEPDDDTSALFHFDADLTGTGRAPDGTRYSVEGVAGVVEYH